MLNEEKEYCVCYKLSKPMLFNNGKTEEWTFLAYFMGTDKAKAQAEVDRLNKERPDHWFNGDKVPENIDYYYLDESELPY